MAIYYTNENTMRNLTAEDRKELDRIICDHVFNGWDGANLDRDNFRYRAEIRFQGMTFLVEIEGEQWFFMDKDDEGNEVFMGFTDDVEEDGITVKRIG